MQTSNSGRIYKGGDYDELLKEIDNWIFTEALRIKKEEKGKVINFSHSITHYRSQKSDMVVTGYVGSAIIMWEE